MRHFLSLLLLFLCTACVQIGGDLPKIDYYLLNSLNDTADTLSKDTLIINLQLVDFPEYLDRKNIVTLTQNNQIKVADSVHWGAPLKGNLMRVFRVDLHKLLPNAQISISPWEQRHPEATRVSLLINKFSGELGKMVQLDIVWQISRKGKTDRQGRFNGTFTAERGYDGFVNGLSMGLDEFSRTIATELAK